MKNAVIKYLKTIVTMVVFATVSLNANACSKNEGWDYETPPHANKPNDKDEDIIRLVSYNVGVFNKDSDNPGNYKTISDMMKELEADAVCLNEVDNETNRTGKVDQLKKFSELMGWNYCYGPAMAYQGGYYGEGISVKDEIVDSYYVALSKDVGSEPRVLVVIEVEDYVIATTHLDHVSTDAQLVQVAEINKVMLEKYGTYDKPVFLGGDLNATPASATLTAFKKNWTVLSRDKATFPSHNPKSTIDFILQLNNGVAVDVVTSDVIMWFETGDATKASDHLPIYVDIKLKK